MIFVMFVCPINQGNKQTDPKSGVQNFHLMVQNNRLGETWKCVGMPVLIFI